MDGRFGFKRSGFMNARRRLHDERERANGGGALTAAAAVRPPDNRVRAATVVEWVRNNGITPSSGGSASREVGPRSTLTEVHRARLAEAEALKVDM